MPVLCLVAELWSHLCYKFPLSPDYEVKTRYYSQAAWRDTRTRDVVINQEISGFYSLLFFSCAIRVVAI